MILDVDTGVDDALAVMLALNSPELDVRAVTVCGGNHGLEQCALNTARVIHFACGHFNVKKPAIGVGLQPASPPAPAAVHGPDGLGGVSHSLRFRNERSLLKNSALDTLRRTLENSDDHSVTIVPTAPQTNLAHWTREIPDLLKSKVKNIIAMGGAFFRPGNVTPAAEFNIWSDPRAASDVLAFCVKNQIPITYVGLDVTYRTLLRGRIIENLVKKHPDNAAARLVRDMTRMYIDYYREFRGLPGCALHDPLALALAMNPDFCVREKHHIAIETKGRFTSGATLASTRPFHKSHKPGIPESYVCTDVDAGRFERFFVKRVTGLENRAL